MARARTTRTIASRIELDYYKRPHPMRAWRARLAATAFALPLLLLAGIVVSGDERSLSPGPLSAAHAIFADRCDTCHAPWLDVPDGSCANCHEGDRHHESQSFHPACSSCHREHGGHATLAQVDDAHCMQCHADLKVRGGQQSLDFARHVESFASHPEFAFRRERIADPGSVKLDHEKHLTLDMPGLGRKLGCGDCHRPDDSGRLMRPIEYARDCASCHELSLQGRLAGAKVTHGRPLDELREELRAAATARVLDAGAPGDAEPAAPRLPSARTRAAAVADESVRQWIDDAVAESFSFLEKTRCAECHALVPDASGGSPSIAPAAIPTKWLPYAEFDHRSHSAQGCTGCHSGIATSRCTADVNLPSIELCRSCHGADGGARASCVLCHDYHPHHEAGRRLPSKAMIELLRGGNARARRGAPH